MDNIKTDTDKKQSEIKHLFTGFALFFFPLVIWEFFLHLQTGSGSGVFSIWVVPFLVAEALLFTFISGWFKKEGANKTITIILLVALWIFYVSQLVYHKVFGSFYTLSLAGMAGDAIGGFGWSLLADIKDAIVPISITAVPLIIAILTLAVGKPRLHYRPVIHIGVFILAALAWLCTSFALPLAGTGNGTAYKAYHSTLVDADTASAKLGILARTVVEAKNMVLGTTEDIPSFTPEHTEDDAEDSDPMPNIEYCYNEIKKIDFKKLAEKTDVQGIKDLCNYLSGVRPTSKNDYTGIFEGYNLIYICGEAFSTYAIDKELTPTLYKLSHEGIVLNNYYNSFRNVTVDGEYAMLNGVWPDLSFGVAAADGNTIGSFPRSVRRYMPMGLGTLFNQKYGIQSRGYHNYFGYYYGRNQYLPHIGFESKFWHEGLEFTTDIPTSDLEMMQQSVGEYINDDRFCVYYMTFSGHGKYIIERPMVAKNYNTVLSVKKDSGLTYDALGYLAGNYELELALQYLMEQLEAAGKLENTVIVLAGDHYPYSLSDAGIDSLAGHHLDQEFEAFENTCIIWNGGLEEPIYVNDYCCNIDILPTVLNLFGIEYDSRLLAGKDIFSDAQHVAVLYNRSFITPEVKYNSATGNAIWSEDNKWSDEERAAYIERMSTQLMNNYSMCVQIEATDFYGFVWENSGLK